jgi:hypothetical protein
MTLLGLQKTKLILPSFVLALLVLLLVGLGAYRQGRRNVAAEQWQLAHLRDKEMAAKVGPPRLRIRHSSGSARIIV